TPRAAIIFAGNNASSSTTAPIPAHRRVGRIMSPIASPSSAIPVRVTASSGQGTKLGTIATSPERWGSIKCVTVVDTNTAAIPPAIAAGQDAQYRAVGRPRKASHPAPNLINAVVRRRGTSKTMALQSLQCLDNLSLGACDGLDTAVPYIY